MSIRAALMAIWPTASASSVARWLGCAEDAGAGMENTVVIVISEFGRTFRENGDHGTDHGHGSVYWVLGGGIKGGRIVGGQVAVSRQTFSRTATIRY